MKISVLSLAKSDLKEIHLRLSQYGKAPSKKFRESFEKFCSQAADMPFMFERYEHNPSYRKAVLVHGYLAFYKVDERKGKIMVCRVLHGKRDIMPFWDLERRAAD